MCSVVVFIEFANSYGSKSFLAEGRMIASSSKPVIPEDKGNIHLVNISLTDFFYITSKLTCFTVIFSRSEFSYRTHLFCFKSRYSFTENSYSGIIIEKSFAGTTVADHIIIKHGCDIPVFLFRFCSHEFCTIETMFFTGYSHKYYCCREFPG